MILGLTLVSAATVALAQQGRSSNKAGTVQIQGNITLNANAGYTQAVASGKGNQAENAVGAIGK